jgi:hypothetical protein
MTNPGISLPRAPGPRNSHYLNRYEKFCKSLQNLNRIKVSGDKLEKHRILPGCLGGEYLEHNTVLMTRREHTIAHILLSKAFPENFELGYCAYTMTHSGGTKIQPKYLNSLEYFQRCERKSQIISESNQRRKVTWGNKISNALTGKKKSKEHRENIKIANANRELTPELRYAMGSGNRGRVQSSESNLKRSRAVSSQKWWYKKVGDETLTVRSQDPPDASWSRGRCPR